MSTNDLLNFEKKDNGIYVLDDSHLAERKSGILVPEEYKSSWSKFKDGLKEIKERFTRDMNLLADATIETYKHLSNADKQVSVIPIENGSSFNKLRNLPFANSLLYAGGAFSVLGVFNSSDTLANPLSLDNLVQENESKEPSCNCIGVSNIHARDGFKSIGGLYLSKEQDGTKGFIPLSQNETLNLNQILDIKSNNIHLPLEMKERRNHGYVINNNNLTIKGTENPRFLDLYVSAIDKRTGCKEGIRIIFSPYNHLDLNSILDESQVEIDPRTGNFVSKNGETREVTSDCIIDQISNKKYKLSEISKEKEEILRRQNEVKDALRQDRDSLYLLTQQIDSILNGNNGLQKEINGDEKDKYVSDRRLQFSVGSNKDYFGQSKLVLGLAYPIFENANGTRLNLGLYGVLPSTSETTAKVLQASGEGVVCHTLVDGELTSSKLRKELELNFPIGNNDLLRLGLGAFANLSLTDQGSSYYFPGVQLSSPGFTEPQISYGDIQEFKDFHLSGGPMGSLTLSFPERNWGRISFTGKMGYNLLDKLSQKSFFPNESNLESSVLNDININQVRGNRPLFLEFNVNYALPGGSK